MDELMNYLVTIPAIFLVVLGGTLLIAILRCHTHKARYRELERDLRKVQSEREKSIRQLKEESVKHTTLERDFRAVQSNYEKSIRQLQEESAKHTTLERDFRAVQSNYEKSMLRLQEASAEHIAVERELKAVQTELASHENNLLNVMCSNLTSMPWLAGMIADFITYDLEVEAKKLDWGSNIQREKKVASIREIRAEAKARIAEAKEAVYQLAYIRELYPAIDDIIDTDYMELELTGKVPEYDPIRNYISKEEWEDLPSAQKDQLALDRYVSSRSKSNWQIGRDYELSVAYEYAQKGYEVDTFGSYMGLEDLGRDVIAKKGTDTVIVQCKYWSKHKTIHEKHIFQLYGTIVSYGIEHQTEKEEVYGVFVTNTTLSQMAHKVAVALNISVVENHKMVDFPRIKCNIGRDEEGGQSKIYHLPMDLQYDVTQIKDAGEFYAFTVEEALKNGFRRAFRWHGGGD